MSYALSIIDGYALFIIEAIVALGLIILVHELGHFLTAKYFGVRVRRFALGMGPIIVKWTRGETEYSLRWIPVGGFVDLAGEHGEADGADDPRGLWRRPPWQRVVIFSAGVVMNVVLALVLFAVAPIVGIQAPVPVVGKVTPSMPAQKAGIEPGDRIVAINGEPIASFEDVIWMVALSPAGTTFVVDLERPGANGAAPERFTKTLVSMRAPGSPAPMLGVEPELAPVIALMHANSLVKQAGLTEGDRILAVNGQAVTTWRGLSKMLADAPVGPLTLQIERAGKKEDLKVDPAQFKVYDYGMAWTTTILGVEPDSPAAKADLRVGDRIAAINDLSWPTMDHVSDAVKAAGADATVRLKIWRQGEILDVSAKTAKLPGADYPRLGFAPGAAAEGPILVGEVEPGGPADKASIRPGDIIRMAGEPAKNVTNLEQLYTVFSARGDQGVHLAIERGGAILTTTLTPGLTPQDRLTLNLAAGPALYVALPRIYNPVEAAKYGFKRTGMWLTRVYANLRQLMTRQVSTKAVGGPVAIVQWSFNVASHGIGTLMDFWGMLSISIAVLNFLPIPPFDGGHVLFVLIEKIKGGPVSLKVQAWVWGAGWAAVGVLFILVMWQDIARLLT